MDNYTKECLIICNNNADRMLAEHNYRRLCKEEGYSYEIERYSIKKSDSDEEVVKELIEAAFNGADIVFSDIDTILAKKFVKNYYNNCERWAELGMIIGDVYYVDREKKKLEYIGALDWVLKIIEKARRTEIYEDTFFLEEDEDFDEDYDEYEGYSFIDPDEEESNEIPLF